MMTKFIEMNLFLQDKDPMPENGREEDFIAVQWIMAFVLDRQSMVTGPTNG